MDSVNPILIDTFDKRCSWENFLEKAAGVVQQVKLQKMALKVEQDLYLYGSSFLRITPNGAEVLDPATVMIKVGPCK